MGFLNKTGLTRLWNKIKATFVAKETGKGLSSNDFTTTEKNKLAGIEAGAQVNPSSLPANGGNADTIDNKHASDFASASHTHTQANITSWLNLGTLNNNTGWGTTTAGNGYTVRWGSDQSGGGGFVIAEKGGQTFIQIDGEVYVNEGSKRLAHTDELPTVPSRFSTSAASNNYLNYDNSGNNNPAYLVSFKNNNDVYGLTYTTIGDINLSKFNNDITKINSLGRYSAPSNGTKLDGGLATGYVYHNGYPCSYGNVINIGGEGDGQLLIGWSGTTGVTERCYVRSRRDADTVWSAWSTLAFLSDIPASSNQHLYYIVINLMDIGHVERVTLSMYVSTYPTGNTGRWLYDWLTDKQFTTESMAYVGVGHNDQDDSYGCAIWAEYRNGTPYVNVACNGYSSYDYANDLNVDSFDVHTIF